MNGGSTSNGQLVRSSLGRIGFIGELYDVRNESFSSRSLLKSTSRNMIECRAIGLMEFDYSFTESYSEMFELLKVEAELQVNILSGLISVEGSGRFLSEEKNLEKSVSCTLVCNMRTASEKFYATFSELLRHIDLEALENDNYTHLITEVNWGAKCLLTLVGEYKSEENKEELKGMLSAQVSKLKSFLSAKGAGEVVKDDTTAKGLKNIRIKVRADVVPEGEWPTTIEGFSKFVQDVPRLLQKLNDGKGNPMSYVMTPLDVFRKLAKLEISTNNFIKVIDESFILSIVYLFEEIAEIKRKLSHLNIEMKNMNNYITDENLKEAKEQQTSLGLKEIQLKKIMSDNWVLVRSGKKSLRELIGQVEKFKCQTLNLYSYETYLESASEILKKLEQVTYLTSLGVLYMGKNDSLEKIMSQYLSCEFLVLVVSSKTREEDSALDQATYLYFVSEASNPQPDTKYVIMDFDYRKEESFMNCRIVTTKCFHLKGSRVLSSDKYADYVAEMESSFLRPSKDTLKYLMHKPANRVPLEMKCPGFKSGNCSHESLKWTCFRCKHIVEYDCENCFYCVCGKIEVENVEYRCKDPKHGNSFVKGDIAFIRDQLRLMRPLKEMNVLIIGQSGVGKSTWINSIINYLTYNSMESAKAEGVICTIPASFDIYSSNLKKYNIKIGEDNVNENTDAGFSATQFPRTYSFIWNERCIRIIDTPGLGDTRGIEQDKKNLSYIMDHIGHLKEIHGICILIKASDNRLHALFTYCIKELLVHLHRAAAKNIVFCFTNARATRYTPGGNFSMLQNLIQSIGVSEELPLGKHNLFFLDNEAFPFLCSLNHPEITYTDELIESFSQSWKISVNETKRLFETLSTFEPHDLKQTISLVNIRRRILTLSKPIVDNSKTIQMNLTAMTKIKEEIENSNITLSELSKKLTYTEYVLETEPLNHPRTVCTNSSCVDYLTYKFTDIRQISYKTHCHPHCYLDNVECETVNNAKLEKCLAMSNGSCQVCGCTWHKHMHITYSQKRVEKQVVDKKIEGDIEKETSQKQEIERLFQELEKKIAQYKKEQEFIIGVSAKMGMFLRKNSIHAYNDSVAEYMEYLITEEEGKPYKTNDDKAFIQNLKTMLDQYHAEVNILKNVLNMSQEIEEDLTLTKMLELENELYKLELTGESIRKSVECERMGHAKVNSYSEVSVNISKNRNQIGNTKSKTESTYSKVKNKFTSYFIKNK